LGAGRCACASDQQHERRRQDQPVHRQGKQPGRVGAVAVAQCQGVDVAVANDRGYDGDGQDGEPGQDAGELVVTHHSAPPNESRNGS
jgi:hypothetical protein